MNSPRPYSQTFPNSVSGMIHKFETLDEMSEAAATLLVDTLKMEVESKGYATIALSGGSTPKALFAKLVLSPWRDGFPWEQTHFFQGDERCVPPTHADSNFRVANELLFSQTPVPVENIHRIQSEIIADEAALNYEKAIIDFFGQGNPLRFDVVLLGMGGDGHTASLFPGSKALCEKQRSVVAVPAPTSAEPRIPRISFTLPLINRAKNIVFLVSGTQKYDLAMRIIDRAPESVKLPAAQVESEGRLRWFLSS